MKKLTMILAIVGILFTFGTATAADVTVTITVPSQYVERLTTMVQAEYMYQGNFSCTGLTVKKCFVKKMIVEQVKKLLFQWERQQARKNATIAADASVSEIEVTSE